jgi:hypothetical protein
MCNVSVEPHLKVWTEVPLIYNGAIGTTARTVTTCSSREGRHAYGPQPRIRHCLIPKLRFPADSEDIPLLHSGSRENIYRSDFQSLRGRALRSFDLICPQDVISRSGRSGRAVPPLSLGKSSGDTAQDRIKEK